MFQHVCCIVTVTCTTVPVLHAGALAFFSYCRWIVISMSDDSEGEIAVHSHEDPNDQLTHMRGM